MLRLPKNRVYDGDDTYEPQDQRDPDERPNPSPDRYWLRAVIADNCRHACNGMQEGSSEQESVPSDPQNRGPSLSDERSVGQGYIIDDVGDCKMAERENGQHDASDPNRDIGTTAGQPVLVDGLDVLAHTDTYLCHERLENEDAAGNC